MTAMTSLQNLLANFYPPGRRIISDPSPPPNSRPASPCRRFSGAKPRNDRSAEMAKAVTAERVRCKAIFAAASGRTEMAAYLAFSTNLRADKAVAVLRVTARGKYGHLLLGSRGAPSTSANSPGAGPSEVLPPHVFVLNSYRKAGFATPAGPISSSPRPSIDT